MSIWSRLLRRRKKQTAKRGDYLGSASIARYADFTVSTRSADGELVNSLFTLRARSRHLARNNPHIRRYIKLMQDNIVGKKGFQLQVKAENTNGGLDTAGNTQIENEWKRWCEQVTTDGKMSFREASNLVVRTWCRDGEVLIQKVQNKKYRNAFSLHFIEADRLDVTLNRKAANGNEIRMGVEVDSFGTPVAYHILNYHPGDAEWTSVPAHQKWTRVPADQIIHIFEKSRPGQTRGEPPMVGVMTDVKMLSGYREAEITNRRVAASKMGFFVKQQDAGPVAALADAEDPDTGALETVVEPGKFSVIPQGYDFRTFDPSGSTTNYAEFEKQILRSIAAGLGVSYVDLAMDLEGVSYSSIRQGALTDRDFYSAMQAFFIEEFAMPVYRAWLTSALDFSTEIKIPPFKHSKFYHASYFRARGWSWVDPAKEVKAAIDAMDKNMVSLTQVVGEQGRDLDEVAAEIERERQMLSSKGLDKPFAKPPPKM